ncbi:TetR/AcrR family transcriptional regulator [Streptosporangium sp. NPDC020072]|uniref:TetR/AcrR family transcriptional regulator n=1 Tax=Streptosporangium jomthongense TaxID=1193683 RepID=A0ABV8F392_9ACTN
MSPRKAAALRDGTDGLSLREHLVATAGRLIAERGTTGLTVRDIARAARVADGVLYNHFEGKEELLALALHAHVRSVERDLGPLPARPGEGTVAGNLRACLTYGLALHRAFLPAFAGLLPQPEVLARFDALPNPLGEGRGLQAMLAGYLRAERDLGRLTPSADPEAAATLLVGVCHELVLPRLLRGAPVPADVPPATADALIATLMNGLAPSGVACTS